MMDTSEVEQTLGADDPETAAILEQEATTIKGIAERFELAALLAVTGFSKGFAFNAGGEDRHFGGSHVITARKAAVLWAGLALFWEFVSEQGLAEKCLIIVTHDFSRGPWNNHFQDFTMNVRDPKTKQVKQQEVRTFGTDHWTACGLYLLSGRFTSGGRLGGILGGYRPAGGTGLGGPPQADLAPPSTLAAVGSALMAVFPKAFRHPGQPDSGRVVRHFWPDFSDQFVLPAIREFGDNG